MVSLLAGVLLGVRREGGLSPHGTFDVGGGHSSASTFGDLFSSRSTGPDW
jgi:hypothetical protein